MGSRLSESRIETTSNDDYIGPINNWPGLIPKWYRSRLFYAQARIERRINLLEHTKSIYVRVTPAEKAQIARKARKCGLSVSEYIRQRCLGYAPREVPPEAYYTLCRKLEDVKNDSNADAVLAMLDELRRTLVEPGRDG